jgi:hypothetical protein
MTLSLWDTKIKIENLSDVIDMSRLASEMRDFNKAIEDDDICDHMENSYLEEVRETILIPKMFKFIHEYTGIDVSDRSGYIRSWVVKNNPHLVETLHQHRHSHFSAVIYPYAIGGDIVFLDPRGNACRWYPSDIKDVLFSNFVHTPKTGDFIIFPSYLEHHSFGINSGERFCIPIDLGFD